MRMIPIITVASLAFGSIVAITAASAQTLGQKKIQKDQEERIVTEVETTNAACGSSVEFSFDWDTFRDEDYTSNYSLHGYCSPPFNAMRMICSDDLGKDAVQSKIKKVVCRRGDERTVQLGEDGTLIYTVSFNSSNDDYHVRDYLLDNL